jgi:hypothetical protein
VFGMTYSSCPGSPFVAGVFSEPARTWPNSFGKITLFQDRPYLLPCLVVGVLCLIVYAHAFSKLDEVVLAESSSLYTIQFHVDASFVQEAKWCATSEYSRDRKHSSRPPYL